MRKNRTSAHDRACQQRTKSVQLPRPRVVPRARAVGARPAVAPRARAVGARPAVAGTARRHGRAQEPTHTTRKHPAPRTRGALRNSLRDAHTENKRGAVRRVRVSGRSATRTAHRTMIPLALVSLLTYTELRPTWTKPASQRALRAIPSTMIDAADAAFLGVGVALAASTGLLLKSVAESPANRMSSMDRGLSSRSFREYAGTDDDSIISRIEDARSTRAPGFVFEVVEGEDGRRSGETDTAAADVEITTQAAREALEVRLASAVEREDYTEAASLKAQIDELSGPTS